MLYISEIAKYDAYTCRSLLHPRANIQPVHNMEKKMHLRAGAPQSAASESIRHSLKAALRAGIAAGAVSLTMLSACGPAVRGAQKKGSAAAQECVLAVPSNGAVTIDLTGGGKAKSLSSYTVLILETPAPGQEVQQIAVTGNKSHASEYLNGKLGNLYDYQEKKIFLSDIQILFIGISARQSSVAEIAADAKMSLSSLLSSSGFVSRWPAPGAASTAACIGSSSPYITGSNIVIRYGAPFKHPLGQSSRASGSI